MNEEGDAEENKSASVVKETLTVKTKVSEATSISQRSVPGSGNRAPCKYFHSKRGCAYGSACKFSHSEPTLSTGTPAPRDEGVKEREREGEGERERERERERGHKGRAPVCRYYITSGCKYGDKCRYRHPAGSGGRSWQGRKGGEGGRERGADAGTDQPQRGEDEAHAREAVSPSTLQSVKDSLEEARKRASPSPPGERLERGGREDGEERSSSLEEPAPLLKVANFPGLRQSGHVPPSHPPSSTPPSHPPTSHPPTSHKSHHSSPRKHGPTELSLGAFLTTPTGVSRPHPHVARPQQRKTKTVKDLRQVELEQLEIRFQDNLCSLVEKGRERTVYRITITPTDPDWNLPYKTFDLLVTFPCDYPSEPLTAELPNDQGLPSAYISHGNQGIARYLSSLPQTGQLMFRPLLRWLDKNVLFIFQEAMKEIVATKLLSTSEDKATPSAPDHTTSEEEKEGEEEEEEEEEGSDEEAISDEESENGDSSQNITTPAKRGTEIRLSGLVMGEGVGVVKCASVKVMLQCTRCHGYQDEIMRAESAASRLCSRCQHCFSFCFHPAVVHAGSPCVGFLDLQGFPCCGKPYPCDICHDTAEDHVMERANRMLCGFCSREQPYSTNKPCMGCGGEMVGGKAGPYWEGGKGCRNKTKMSRNDIHKYTSSAMKTHSKKQERVGQQGKASRTST